MDVSSRRVIAVCASWEDEENLNLFLSHLIESAEPRRFLPVCVTFDRNNIEARDEESIRELVSCFQIPHLAGFMLFGEMIRSDVITGLLIRLAHKKHLPVFMLERPYDGCINLPFAYRDGFEQVVRHMIEVHGVRDVVFVAGIRGNSYSEDRIAICRRLLEEKGASLPPEKVIYGDFWDMPTNQALDAYFAGGGTVPEAFICANDSMAMAVCVYLAEKGLRVPDNVLVSGLDGILFGGRHEPTITTAEPDFAYMYSLLLDRVERWQPEETGRTEMITIPMTFLRRHSCGCQRERFYQPSQEIGELKKANLDYARHIREMGGFIRQTLNMSSLRELTDCIPPLFSRWPEPYYCAAVLNPEDHGLVRTILHARGGQFFSSTSFRRDASPIPDTAAVLSDPAIRILLVHLLQNRNETMGYIVSGLRNWGLREEQRFEEQALFLSTALSAVVNNRRLLEANTAMQHMAEHDYLTSLYNRRGFLRELERLLSLPEMQEKTLTLFSVDMDRLKKINDSYGHHEGDFAIQCLAQAILKVTDQKGICARYGGDEFAFAFFSGAPAVSTESIREEIETEARRVCGPKEYLISASIGAVSCPVRNHPPLDQLLAESDRVLYADKSARRQN